MSLETRMIRSIDETIDCGLNVLQRAILPYIHSVLVGNPAPEIGNRLFEWNDGAVSYSINPFTRTLRTIVEGVVNDVPEEDARNAIRQASGNIAHLFDCFAEDIMRTRGDVPDIIVMGRMVDHYLMWLNDLTRFIIDYDANNPREQTESDLHRIITYRRAIFSGTGSADEDYEERSFSPQFLLPVQEQIRNYNELRGILERIASGPISQEQFRRASEEMSEAYEDGPLYRADIRVITGGMRRQLAARILQDSLIYKIEDIRALNINEINQSLSYENLSRRMRRSNFVLENGLRFRLHYRNS